MRFCQNSRRAVSFALLGLTLAGCSTGDVTEALSAAPDPKLSQLSLSTQSATADGQSSVTLTATILDAEGAPVSGVPVTFAATGSANAISGGGTTDVHGNVSAQLSSTRAESKTITVSVTVGGASMALTASSSVTFVASAASQLGFVVQPVATASDATLSPAVVVGFYDAGGNLVTAGPATGSVTLAFGSSPHGAVLDGTLTQDLVGGVATFADLSISEAGTGYTLVATMAGYKAGKSDAFKVLASGPSVDNSSLVASVASVNADASSVIALTFTLKDDNGNPAQGAAVTFRCADSNVVFSPAHGSTNGGVLTTHVSSTHAAAAVILNAASGGINLSTQVAFTAGAPDVTMSTVTALNQPLTAHLSTGISMLLQDAYGNPVANQNVVLSSDAAVYTFSPAIVQTDATGLAQSTFSSDTAGDIHIIATALGQPIVAPVHIDPAAIDAAKSKIVASPNPTQVYADTAVTATVEDAYGNTISNKAVSFSSNTTDGAFTNNASALTDAHGLASLTYNANTTGAHVLTATVQGVSVSTSLAIGPAAPSSSASSVGASPNPTAADGVSTTTLTLTLRDAHSNPIVGASTLWPTSAGHDVWTAAGTPTDASGRTTATLATTLSGARPFVVQAQGVSVAGNANFFAVASAGNSSVTFSASPAPADGTPVVGAVSINDYSGAPVTGVVVAVTSSNATDTLTQPASATDVHGNTSFTILSTHASQRTLSITAGSMSFTKTLVFEAAVCHGTTLLPGARAFTSPKLTGTSVVLAHVASDVLPDLVAVDNGNINIYQVSLTPPQLFPQPAVKPPYNFDTVVAADVEGTTFDDIILIDNTTSSIVVLTNGSSFTSALTTPLLPGDPGPYALVGLNLNGDTALDLAVVSQSNVSTWISDGTGLFANQNTFALGSAGPHKLVRGTWSDNLNEGVAVLEQNQNDVLVFFNSIVGLDAIPARISLGATPQYIASANLDGDAVLDIVVGTIGGAVVAFGNSTNTFGSPQAVASFASATRASEVAVGDTNHDGHADLFISNPAAGEVTQLLGSAAGTFTTSAAYAASGNNLLPYFSGDANYTDLFLLTGDTAAVLQTSPTNAQLLAGVTWPMGATASSPAILRASSVTADSYPDVVYVAPSINGIGVLPSSTSRTLPAAVYSSFTNNCALSAARFATGDVDHDGDNDVALGCAAGIYVSLNNGTGGFTDGAAVALPQPIVALEMADLNADGLADIVYSDAANSGLQVLVNTGASTFRQVAAVACNTEILSALVVGAFGGSGAGVVGVTSSGSLSSYNIDASGVVTCLDSKTAPALGISAINRVAAVDWNHDGKLDVALLGSAASYATGGVVALNLGGGVFSFPTTPLTFAGGRGVAAADFNNDGFTDLVSDTGTGLFALSIQGSTAAATLYSDTIAADLVSVDMDQDGNTDVVTANALTLDGAVFFQTGCAAN